MVAYDEKVLYQFAEQLYRQAAQLLWSYGIMFGLLGAAIGGALGADQRMVGPGAILGGVLFALIGVAIARPRAFVLRLQAQTALCQAKIEENTRHG